MITYISILRGINVSGHRMIKMQALKELLSSLGFQNIQTYIQSGNIVFQYKKTDHQKLEKKIANAIIDKFTFDVPVIVMELCEFQQIIVGNPFVKDKTKDLAYLHVTFLAGKPDLKSFNKIKEGFYQPDEFYFVSKAIYLYCPTSYSNSKLTNGFFEKKLKITATTRNWKTINEIQNLAVKISK
ncbi:MAG: DUF1697 domain-containing protein [Bacteroidia bacterium]